ncbi:unnamed protein product [Didymodactylos carnosus]|uniref:Chibby n=1 Tax=Didymodactylos carnosus TaxID=1234261 RepID=A0A813ZX33_9BILA|nr:unnamed protein product [Didymodactylos carnosus]CAF1395515.1 unnamed protein product [Didymodactylos carnosus]CAF3686694.1 unnamed protein product [Didymodactylos carnosus]CAF4202912.1 unnamed protein product [Didymodactylos carnosus]
MSFLRNSFSIKKTKPRKHVSRNPQKLQAEEMARELGTVYGVIDVKIADQKIIFDAENGDWQTGGAISSGQSHAAQKLKKQTELLQEENNMLKLKVEVLLDLVAESAAEISSTRK